MAGETSYRPTEADYVDAQRDWFAASIWRRAPRTLATTTLIVSAMLGLIGFIAGDPIARIVGTVAITPGRGAAAPALRLGPFLLAASAQRAPAFSSATDAASGLHLRLVGGGDSSSKRPRHWHDRLVGHPSLVGAASQLPVLRERQALFISSPAGCCPRPRPRTCGRPPPLADRAVADPCRGRARP